MSPPLKLCARDALAQGSPDNVAPGLPNGPDDGFLPLRDIKTSYFVLAEHVLPTIPLVTGEASWDEIQDTA
jgi:hypothetical protein